MMNLIQTILRPAASVVLALSIAGFASADRHPVYAAADAYRDAVKDFERQVFRSRGADRIARTLADELEDQTSRIKREARDLDDFPRLIAAYDRALQLQQQIETVILADPRNPLSFTLGPAWQRVLAAGNIVGGHIAALQSGGVLGPLNPGVTGLGAGFSTRPTYGNVYGASRLPSFGPATLGTVPATGIRVESFQYRLPGGAIFSRPPVVVPAQPDCPPTFGPRTIGGFSIGANLQRF